eukprot:403335906
MIADLIPYLLMSKVMINFKQAYLLGKIFSVSANPSNLSTADKDQDISDDYDSESQSNDEDESDATQSFYDQDDYTLGQLLNAQASRLNHLHQASHNLNEDLDNNFFGVSQNDPNSALLNAVNNNDQDGVDDQAMQEAYIEDDQKRQAQNSALKIDFKTLVQDEEGLALVDQMKSLQQEHKQVIENKRKQHEHMVREQKELMTLINRIKTNNQLKGQNGIDELLRECQQALYGNSMNSQGHSQLMSQHQDQQQRYKIMHPVFVELDKFTKNQVQNGVNSTSQPGQLSQSQNALQIQQISNSQQTVQYDESLRPWSLENRDKIRVIQL